MSYQTQQGPAEGTSPDFTYGFSSSPCRSGSLRSRNSESRSSSIGPESFHTAGSAESFETAEGPDDSKSFSDSGSNESLTRGST